MPRLVDRPNEWRIYNSHATVPVEQKLFRIVRVTEPATQPGQTLRLLAKSQMADHLIDALWKSDFVDRQVRDALRSLFAPEPDPSVIRLIRSRAPSLSRPDVRAALGRLRLTFDFPLVSVAESFVPAPATSPTTKNPPVERSTAVGPVDGTPWRHVTLAQLIDEGFVRVPLNIERRYLGVGLTARIESPDRIVVSEGVFDSLSTAGGMARKSVPGAPTRQPHPQTNGWTFWQYRTTDGTLRPLDDLRRQLHDNKVVSLGSGRRIG